MKREDAIALAVALTAPQLVSGASAYACRNDVKGPWYTTILKKPKWNPPNWAFGAVWPVLYVSQSLASWIVWKTKGVNRALPLGLYAAQLVLNLIWQPLFFKAHRVDLALADSSAVLGLAAAAAVTMTRAAGDHKVAVAALMTPYVGWLAFATALTAQIYKDNPKANKLDKPAEVVETTVNEAMKTAKAQ